MYDIIYIYICMYGSKYTSVVDACNHIMLCSQQVWLWIKSFVHAKIAGKGMFIPPNMVLQVLTHPHMETCW